MPDFDAWMDRNREAAYGQAEQNTTRDAGGRAVITKDDEWRGETEWDEMFHGMSGK